MIATAENFHGRANNIFLTHSENAMSEEKYRTRRSVLKTTALATAGLAGTTVTAAGSTGRSRVQVTLGSVNAPIKQNTQDRLWERAVEAYHQEHGEYPKRAARFRSADDNPLVAFAVGFDDNGVPHYFSAKTPDPEEVAERQSAFQKRVERFESAIQGPGVFSESQSVTTQSKTWEIEVGFFGSGGTDTDAGTIHHDIEVYRLTDDGTSDGETFAAIQIMDVEPDVYSNLSGDTFHDWSPAQNSPGVQSSSLTDYAPVNAISGDGTKTASLTARDTSLSWSWDHNGDVTTDSNTDANKADQLHGDFTQSYGGGTGDKEEEMGCGTAVETNQPSTGYYDIVTLTAKETFFYTNGSGVYDEETVTDEETMSIDYEYL